MKLYLVRHGQSVGNERGHLQGQDASFDKGLSELGKQQSQKVGQRMAAAGLTALYTSPLPRAAQTAAWIASACRLQARERDCLKEVSYGDLEGRSKAETFRLCPQAYDPHWRRENHVPGGEPIARSYSRARAAIRTLTAAHDQEDVICLVTHGEFLSRLIDTLLEATEVGFPRYLLDNASVTHFARHPGDERGVWLCHYMGDTGHLRGLGSPAGKDGW